MNEHAMHIRTDFSVNYPDHPPRTESHVFKATKAHWHKLGARCWVCGTAEKIEIHHKFIEWADSDGVDWDKVRAEHPDFDWSTFKEPCDFIDSVYNTEPLCELHHRGPAPFGKHWTPEPIWRMQRYARSDFVYAEAKS
ncbi:MAG: hypothetical protein JO142_02320 [Burkholderiales bacterium]|nr:hypothetical protein [Burkholderiales bacterium]